MRALPPLPSAASIRLTPLQRHYLVLCYIDGRTTDEIGRWYGKSGQAVRRIIERAKASIVRQGYPEPQPYGRGSRRELRACLPQVSW
jgi:predicted RNA polymerase sigma factor